MRDLTDAVVVGLYSVVTAFPAQGYLFSVGERCCCTVAACRDPIKMLRSSFVHEYLLLPSVLCCPNKLLLLWVAACRDRTTLRLYVVSKLFPVQGIYLVVAEEVV